MTGRLRERLGEEFLKALPASPGVYLMLGDGDELLYVGKAKSLRTRIRSYTRLTPAADPRLISLIAKVRTIRWEATESEARALARETELLRVLRPPFNRAHTARTDYLGIGITEMQSRVRLRMGANGPLATEVVFCAYPFEAGTPSGYVALVRALAVVQPGVTRPRVPSRVTGSAGYDVAVAADVRKSIVSFVAGRSPRLLSDLEQRLGACEDEIVRRSTIRELEVLRAFYAAGPRAARRLQRQYGDDNEAVTGDVLFRLMGAALVDQLGAKLGRDERAIENLIGQLKRDGFGFREIATRLNRDAIPRLRGGGRWTAAEVAEVVGELIERELAERARELR